MLRHFPKMAPFCIADIPIPFPCLRQALLPKINVVFWILKSFTSDNIDFGVRLFTAFKRNEIVDKSTRFKQVCQLLLSLIVAIVHSHLCKPWT